MGEGKKSRPDVFGKIYLAFLFCGRWRVGSENPLVHWCSGLRIIRVDGNIGMEKVVNRNGHSEKARGMEVVTGRKKCLSVG